MDRPIMNHGLEPGFGLGQPLRPISFAEPFYAAPSLSFLCFLAFAIPVVISLCLPMMAIAYQEEIRKKPAEQEYSEPVYGVFRSFIIEFAKDVPRHFIEDVSVVAPST